MRSSTKEPGPAVKVVNPDNYAEELLPGQDATRGNSNGVVSPDGKKMLMVSRKPVVELAKDKAKKK
jgi:Tol biopolymer transport system component